MQRSRSMTAAAFGKFRPSSSRKSKIESNDNNNNNDESSSSKPDRVSWPLQLLTRPAEPNFVAYPNKIVHQHKHYRNPHMHNTDCNRLVSGYDLNRDKRFYFTTTTTPVRVYIKYERGVSSKPKKNKYDALKKHEQHLNGQKLNAATLRNKIGLSSKFIKEAQNLVFNIDTLSFAPITTTTATHGVTYELNNTNLPNSNRTESRCSNDTQKQAKTKKQKSQQKKN